MRLYDCPVFYKILRHDARIDADSRSSAGIYIQACRAKQLQFEHQKALHRETVRDQGMDLSNFSEQFRRAQIGSRASSFMNLKHLIHDYIRRTRANRIVAVATETSF